MPEKRKNILFIMTDDQGEWALGCSGNSELHTPNIDALAAGGTRFDNFFCVSPVCSPARMSVYTGQIPSQHGVHDWLSKGHLDESVLSDDILRAFEQENPPYEYRWSRFSFRGDRARRYLDGKTTFTGLLAADGYECGISGKWHMGDSPTPQAGFTYWRTTANGGDNYLSPVVLEDGRMVMKRGRYMTDHITDNALEFFNVRDSGKPFFLAVHYTAPHSPWSAPCHPAEFINMYENCPFDSVPNDPPHPWVGGVDQTREQWDSKPHPGVRFIHTTYAPIRSEWQQYRRESLRGYFAAVTAMDRGVGRILDELRRRGLENDTLVIFTSDNGSNMGQHGIFGKGNGTYPMNMYDTSVKIPAIFSCPGYIPSGRVCHEMASHYDIFETLLDCAGVPFEKPDSMPGRSILPLLRGQSPENGGGEVVVFDEYGPVRMIRTHEWKYVRRYPDGPDELYDLVKDPGEYVNRVDDPGCAVTVAELKARLGEWFDRYADPSQDGRGEDVRGKGQDAPHSFVR